METTGRRIIARLIGASVLCSTILANKMLFAVFAFRIDFYDVLILLQYALLLAGSIGVIIYRRWGFVALYASFPLTFFGVPILPVPLPEVLWGYGHFTLGAVIIGILVVIHVIDERAHQITGRWYPLPPYPYLIGSVVVPVWLITEIGGLTWIKVAIIKSGMHIPLIFPLFGLPLFVFHGLVIGALVEQLRRKEDTAKTLVFLILASLSFVGVLLIVILFTGHR